MRIALAQVNTFVGDLEGNVARLAEAAARGAALGAELVVLPEMAVTGYPPRDLLCDDGFVAAALDATEDLARRVGGMPPVLVGTIARASHRPPRHPGLHDVAALLEGGSVRTRVAKRLLPPYDVFHEPRWFLPAGPQAPVEVAARRLGVLVCEDFWDAGYDVHPPDDLRAAGAEILVCLSASPFRKGVLEERLAHARQAGAPTVYVNAVGGQDELVFDGRSFATDARGRLLARLASFEEDVAVVDVEAPAAAAIPNEHDLDVLHRALVCGIRDFADKNRLGRAFLGLSGGVDSSVVARLAADALGAARVTCVALPSRYTDPRSTEAARTLARALGIGFEVLSIEALHAAAAAELVRLLDAEPAGRLADENVQARLRMLVLMAFVNRHGGFLLNTSNKTELSLGYSTLYGDMSGALSPLGDVTKPEVYALARHLGGFPSFVLERAPSAELRPGQVDPFDYDVVAPRVEELVLGHRSDAALRRSEHKRWQMGVVLKVSRTAFGTGRMVPITRR
ncbi:MAG TPA: NAD(+) synthase [Vicinamibacteria bacterium]|nr:NAD(+) synthase [Vicinamibacteria bacterium]